MCSSYGGSERGVLAMVDQALELLRAAGAVPLGGAVSDVELTQLVQRLTAVERIAAGQRAAVVREIEQRQAAKGPSAGSAADLLARTLRLTPGEARREAELADGLALLPDTQAALADGRIGIGQAEVAVRKAAEVKDRDDAELLAKQIDAPTCWSSRSTRSREPDRVMRLATPDSGAHRPDQWRPATQASAA